MKIQNTSIFTNSIRSLDCETSSTSLLGLPVTDENMRKLLETLNKDLAEGLNQGISDLSVEDRNIRIAILALGFSLRATINIYFGDLEAAVADKEQANVLVQEIGESGSAITDGETTERGLLSVFDLFVLGRDTEAYEKLSENAQTGDPIALLLLKAQGQPIPNLESLMIAQHVSSTIHTLFLEKRYEEVILELDRLLIDSSGFNWQKRECLHLRAFCKVLLNDYHGALADFDCKLDLATEEPADKELIQQALIHYLCEDREQAKAVLEKIPFTNGEGRNLHEWLMDFNDDKWTALIIENVLRL